MAYSIYLLHGILLFVLINYFIGSQQVRAMSATTYWLLVSAISPILILWCRTTCRVIELPAMQQVDRVTGWYRSLSNRHAYRLRLR